VTIVWKRAAVIAAGIRGRRKAALAMASARPRPITLARVAWLDRPIIPETEREKAGAKYRKPSKTRRPEFGAPICYFSNVARACPDAMPGATPLRSVLVPCAHFSLPALSEFLTL
jgi:hypothetical protein